jgi:hypothetical protein
MKDTGGVSNEMMLGYHPELDIVTQLFVSCNETSSSYEIICFDRDNGIDILRNVRRFNSDQQLIEHLRTCQTQIILIISCSNLTIQPNYIGKIVRIYLFQLTDNIELAPNVHGCFNDTDHLLIELTKDLVILGNSRSYNERNTNNQVKSYSNWREVYFHRLQQISLKRVRAQESRETHLLPIKNKTVLQRR